MLICPHLGSIIIGIGAVTRTFLNVLTVPNHLPRFATGYCSRVGERLGVGLSYVLMGIVLLISLRSFANPRCYHMPYPPTHPTHTQCHACHVRTHAHTHTHTQQKKIYELNLQDLTIL